MLRKNDAVEMAPNIHSVLYENERVRVLDVMIKPKDVAKMHWHPDSVSYVLGGGKLIITKQDGTRNEIELKTGQVFSGKEGLHEVENIGNSVVHTIQVELKQ